MKRLFTFLIILFLCYIIYYDFNVGTLPAMSMTKIEKTTIKEENVKKPAIPYYEVKIKEGDTVLSITETFHGELPTSIEQIVKDFELLNENVKAESITNGHTYLFPDYTE